MSSLISLNLSNFDMSEVTDIGWMFIGCSSLKSLDLSNFYTDSVTCDVEHLFNECINLEYINLKNAHFKPHDSLFSFTAKKNVVFCNEDPRIISKVEGYGCAVINCSENWRQIQKKINLFNNECVDDCSETNNNKYNYKNECHENCPEGTYNNNYICEDCHPDCRTCEKGSEIYTTNCKSCADENKNLYFGNCYINEYIDNIIINDDTNFDYILDNFLSLYIPENGNGNSLAIKKNDEFIYHLTNSQNEIELLKNKSKNLNKLSIIDLGECETKLKDEYHINETDSLILIKIEKISNKASEKNISFEV